MILFDLHFTSHHFKSIIIHNTVISLINLLVIPIAFDQINQSIISVVKYHLSILYLAILEKFWNQVFKSLHRISILHTNLQPQHVQNHKIKPTIYLSTKSWLIPIKTVVKQQNFWYYQIYLMQNIGITHLLLKIHFAHSLIMNLSAYANTSKCTTICCYITKTTLKSANWIENSAKIFCTHFACTSFATLYSKQNPQS